MKKLLLFFFLVILSLPCLSDEKQPNQVLKFLKANLKTENAKFHEVHTQALEQSLRFLDNVQFKFQDTDAPLSTLDKSTIFVESSMNNYISNFRKEPNDIKNNKILYDKLKSEIPTFETVQKLYEEQVIHKAYQVYLSYCQNNVSAFANYAQATTPLQKRDIEEKINSAFWNYRQYENYLIISNNIAAVIYSRINKNLETWKPLKSEVYNYSYNYEKQKYENWCAKNNKKRVAGSLSNYVYYAHAPAPELGYLYKHVPTGDFHLKVLQSVPGGVILTGDYLGPYGPTGYGTIFLQTSKQFADGQIIREGIVAEYKGFYDYYTVLGAKKRIYKFYRLGETEIKNNFEIPGQPFYFYLPY